MRNLRKNKFVILAICVIVVSIAYFVVQKMIDNTLETDSDIIMVNDEDIIEEKSVKEEGEVVIVETEQEKNLDKEVDLVMEESEGEPKEEVSENKKIYVYITGEVNIPGVVILNEGSRIVDAINAAGGTTNKADISKVNLVYVLEDGMKVNIPNNDDLKNNSSFEYIISSSGEGAKEEVSNNSLSSGITSSDRVSSSSNYVVNINTATQTELESLPGIGPSLALKIINYRKENGKFSAIEDIKNVSGIGEKKFEELKGYITV